MFDLSLRDNGQDSKREHQILSKLFKKIKNFLASKQKKNILN